MDRLVSDAALARVTGADWVYWQPSAGTIMELAASRGHATGLVPHFHDETQIILVLSGQRSFLIGGEVVAIPGGCCACIPAGVPHRALADPPGTACLNAYVPAASDGPASASELRDWLHAAGAPFPLEPGVAIHVCRPPRAAGSGAIPAILPNGGESGGLLEARLAMSREGYSRMFARRSGMPPHAFGLIRRLNHARQLLRSGEAIAAAAAEAGFADQSHLGRCFRRAFGTTPGRYRLH